MRAKLVAVALVFSACAHPKAPRTAEKAEKRVEKKAETPQRAESPSQVESPPPRSPRPLPPLNEKTVCAMQVASKGASRPGASAFTQGVGSCIGNDPFCDVVDLPPKGADACFVANTNITRAERESRWRPQAPALVSSPWDRKKAPRFWDRVNGHLHLGDGETTLLHANGFVALGREHYDSYAAAYHSIFQEQLPVFVSVDSIFHAIFRATETLLAEVERTSLGPKLARTLDRLRATLAQSRGLYDKESADDIDLYLVVAHRLLHAHAGDDAKPARARSAEVEAAATSLVEAATNAIGLDEVTMFGRERMVDFTQMTPRGYYANSGMNDEFKYGKESIYRPEYFRAMMWLSRIEWNLVSRSCRSSQPGETPNPAPTPRETKSAIALADLVARAGVGADLKAFEDVYSVFAGKREDVSLAELASVATKAGIGPRDVDAPAKLEKAIGGRFARTARTHFMPEGTTDLPVITTMFGPRIVPDVAPLTHLVHDAVPQRFELGAADVAYVLGHDRARRALAPAIANHPALGVALDKARAEVAEGVRGKSDVYSTWLGATLRLADSPAGKGVVPSFMKTDAYADMKTSSAIAAYAQIRHTFVLLAAQGYDAYGCEIPDGYVEPALGAWDALLGWARAARTAVPAQATYFRRVEDVLSMLRGISVAELAGAPLSEPQRRWLGMVSEITPLGGWGGDSGEPPKYTGWYFDLFPDRELGALKSVALVADYFTLTNASEVRYVGVDDAALGVFVVDTGGEPRAMVGPITRSYELASPLSASRLDDEAAVKAEGKRAPWRTSYFAPAKEAPKIEARTYSCGGEVRIAVSADRDLGEVTITPLDHHGDPNGVPLVQRVTVEPAVVAFAMPEAAVEGIHFRVSTPGAARADVTVAVDAHHARFDLGAGVAPGYD